MPLDQLKLGLISLRCELEPDKPAVFEQKLDDEIPALAAIEVIDAAAGKKIIRVKAGSSSTLKQQLVGSLAVTPEAAE